MRKLAVRLCAAVFLAMVSLVTVAMAEQEESAPKIWKPKLLLRFPHSAIRRRVSVIDELLYAGSIFQWGVPIVGLQDAPYRNVLARFEIWVWLRYEPIWMALIRF